MMRHVQLLCLLAAFMASSAAYASDSGGLAVRDSLMARFDRQRYEYPQEKFHVMTDKEEYVCGDTVWMRVFVVDATTHQQVAASRYVYVELVDPMNEVTTRVKIQHDKDGVYAGYIPLDASWAEGDYMLSAYTMFSQGVGERFFFKKNIPLYSPYRVVYGISMTVDDGKHATLKYTDAKTGEPKKFEKLTARTLSGREYESEKGKGGKRITVDTERGDVVMVRFDNFAKYFTVEPQSPKLDVTFHPEGGYLIAGMPCRVAFKAIDGSGRGSDVEVTVKDSDGTVVAAAQSLHRGMGILSMIPREGERYTAHVTARNGDVHTFGLPDVDTGKAVLRVDNRGGIITLSAAGKVPAGTWFALQSRGVVLLSEPCGSAGAVSVREGDLPEGIAQALLVDVGGNVLSDRLVFVNHDDSAMSRLTFRDSLVSTRCPVKAVVDLPAVGDFAVTVTDNDMVMRQADTDIRAQLLLQGGLSGHVECPVEYFMEQDRNMATALDALMMTQGWHRYDVGSVASGYVSEPVSFLEIGQQMGGVVKSLLRGKPMGNVTVNMLAPLMEYANTTMTDGSGHFFFDGIDFPEGTKFILQAINKRGNNESNFAIEDPEYPRQCYHSPAERLTAKQVAEAEPDAINDAILHNDKFNVMLKEVTVTAMKRRQPENIYELLARRSFDSATFEERRITKLDEVLRLIAGFDPDKMTYRGKGVGIFVDGTRWDDPDRTSGTTFNLPSETSKFQAIIEMNEKTGEKTWRTSQSKSLNASMGRIIAEAHQTQMLTEAFPFSTIKRIDFIQPNEAVVLGNKLSGGALMITTKDGSEIEWEQPLHLKVHTPLGYQKPVEFYSPKYGFGGQDDELPDGMDRRSTVYWNPSVKTDVDGRASFEFYTTDNPRTTYTVRVEGLTASGEPFTSTSQLKVNGAQP